jgi:hypothetical protein
MLALIRCASITQRLPKRFVAGAKGGWGCHGEEINHDKRSKWRRKVKKEIIKAALAVRVRQRVRVEGCG